MVKVKAHTEFEIRFTDPATQQLHPGVRETIRNGENLYVSYPGYSDYRHIPVIGRCLFIAVLRFFYRQSGFLPVEQQGLANILIAELHQLTIGIVAPATAVAVDNDLLVLIQNP